MISAAAAAGITLALGTPLGGVIFSMEVTSSIYLVKNLVKAFSCATMCIIFSKIFKTTSKNMNLFISDKLKPLNDTEDLIFFLILGILCGLIGACLSTFVSKLSYIRKKSNLKLIRNRFLYALICAIVISSITFTLKPLMIYDRYMLSYIFGTNLPKEVKSLEEINHHSEAIQLLVLFAFKFLITVLSLTINMPVGIFAPFFLIGGYFGRFYAHLLKYIFDISEESIYAIVGAACVMSGATHSISSALIIFELTGQTSYIIPLIFSCLIANLTSQALSTSFFDVFLLMKNLPYLPSIKSNVLYTYNAKLMMSNNIYPFEINKINCINSLELLFNIPKKYAFSIPVVNSKKIIKYTIKPKKLVKYIFHLYENFKLNYDPELQRKIFFIIKFIQRKLGKKYSSFFEYLKYKVRKIFISEKEKEILRLNKNLEEETLRLDLEFLKEYSINDNLILKHKIDIEDPSLNSDKSAFTIDVNFPYIKIQFLFTFLNVSHMYVYEDGSLVGIITKEEFVRKSMLL